MTIEKLYVTLGVFIGFSIFSISCCYAVNVGDSYGGGTVFCVSKTPNTTECLTKGSGDHGLIMANEDQVNYIIIPKGGVTWSSVDKITKAISDDDGYTNTKRIIYALPNDNPTNNAAWLSHDYSDPKEKHTDWYLPSKNELNKMYEFAKANSLTGESCTGSKPGGVQCFVGGQRDSWRAFWSSTESLRGYDGVWYQSFVDGYKNDANKDKVQFGVRAVRAF